MRHSLITVLIACIFSIPPGLAEQPSVREEGAMFEKVIDGLEFPEGPAWDGKGSLYLSNCLGGWIEKYGPEGSTVFLRASEEPYTFERTNGLAFCRDGSLLACEYGRGAILRMQPDGKVEPYAEGYGGKSFERPNDLALDPSGNLYFTDPHQYTRTNPDGVVYRVDGKTREVKPVAEGLGFPNGIAFSANAKSLYVCESAFNRVLKFAVQPDGSLGSQEVFAELPGGDPDGIAFDKAGNLYVAHFGGGAVYILAPDGSVKQKIPAPGKKPTNVEFAGKDLRTLYVTECETNALYRMKVDVPGMALFGMPVD